MRYLALGEVVELHRRLLEATGGASGIRDFGALESAIAQPKATFGASIRIPRWLRKRRRWVFRWSKATRLSMATSVLSTPPWRRSSSSTAARSTPLAMTKNT